MAASQTMLMTSAPQRVAFSVTAIGDVRAAPTSASASVIFDPSGTLTSTGNSTSASTSWIQPAPPPGPFQTYYIRFTLNSGTAPTGPASGSIVDLTTARTWVWNATSGQVRTANGTIAIFSDAGGTNLLASATFNVDVEST